MFDFPFKTLVAKLNENGTTYSATLTDDTYDKDGRELIMKIHHCRITIEVLLNESPDREPYYMIIAPEEKESDIK